MQKIKAILVGAGSRGMGSLASYALRNPYEVEFVAVAEPNKERRETFKCLHNIEKDLCFNSWEELLAKPKFADTAIIATQDKMHFMPTIEALSRGYNVLLEKPMSTTAKECVIMSSKAEELKVLFTICHVLRYTDFFAKIKDLVSNNAIGKLISIQHNENVGFYHHAHSFVRGSWRSSKDSSPMILAKSCHDMDILQWLANSNCKNISSFGSLNYFKKENAPTNAPLRCLDGCEVRVDCAFYAPKTYLTSNINWPSSVISQDLSLEGRINALKNGPYGRCVFHCDNDVVDHQVVNMEFENGVTAAFTMCAFTNEITRTIKLMGTKGEIRGHFDKNEIDLINFNSGIRDIIQLPISAYGHGGGDDILMRDFIENVRHGSKDGLTSARVSLHSHLMAFAAEEARLEKRVINMTEFTRSLTND